MAQAAGHRGVLPGQREAGGAVVERSGSPGGDRMAGGALCSRGWEARSNVIRYISPDGSSALERSCVAAIAVRRIQRVVIIGVAGSARGREVRPDQRKSGDAVIERRSVPTCRGVTVGAIPYRKRCTRCRMHRVVCSLPGGQVALRISAVCQEQFVRLKLPLIWHSAQVTAVCCPVSGKPVVLWLNVPAAQVVIGWQEAHCAAVVGKPAAM